MTLLIIVLLVVKVKLDDEEKLFEVDGGVVEVLKNKVIVLAS